MQLGMVGLGRMGGNMAKRLKADGHDVPGFARLIRAQAAGDFESLKERGRRVARIQLQEVA